MAGQHASLSPERWASFSLDQQILMIANEMNRASKLLAPADADRLRRAYERVLQLTDVTIQVQQRRSLRRELLRWRDLVAALYLGSRPEPPEHARAFRALLGFTGSAYRQMALVCPRPASRA